MASSWAVTLAGVTRTTLVSEVRWRKTINGIGTASFTVKDESAGYVPGDDDVVAFVVGGATVWAGTIANPAGISFLVKRAVGLACSVTAQDHNQLLQRIVINDIFDAQILKATLQELTGGGSLFAAQGITLDAGQANGPALSTLSAPWLTGEQLVDYLSTMSAYVRNVDAAKALKMWAIGSVSSGVTLNAANANVLDAAYDVSRYDYRSQQWVVFGPTGTLTVIDRWTGDGVTQEFPQRYPGAIGAPDGATKPDTITVSGVVFPVGVNGVDSMEWTWRQSDLTMVHTGGAVTTATNGITATYDSQFPNAVYVEDAGEAATRPWVRVDFNTNIQDVDEAEAYGNALIRQNLPRPKLPKVSTLVETINPGDTVVVDFPGIGLSAVTCFVRSTETRVIPSGDQVVLETVLDLIAGTELPSGSTTDLWKRIIFGGSAVGGGAAGGSGSGGSVVPSTSPSPVDYGGTMTRTAPSGTTSAQNVPDARDIPGDGRTWVVDALTRTQFAAHTATPSIARCSAAHVIEATVAAGTATASTSSDPSAGNWQSIGPYLTEVGKFYRLQVTMNNAAGSGTAMGVAHVSA